jgi:glycosyltransferase involved in cell wall biosynthesis
MITGSISRNGGGVSEVVRLLATELARAGETVEVLSLRDEHSEADTARWGDIKVRCFKIYGPARFGFSPGLLWATLRSKADVAHVHGLWQFQGLCALLWAKIRSRPYVVTPHGMLDPWITGRSRALKRLVSATFQDRLLKDAASVHALTTKEQADTLALFPTARTDIIPNFVHVEETDQTATWRTSALAKRRVYLFLGRIHDKKGWRELCAAWERLCSSDTAFSSSSALVFCGWLDGASDFEAQIADLYAQFGNVYFPGSQYGEQKAASLRAADVFILPSKSEGLPMVILEAWAAGLPVLMTSACNLPIGFERGAAVEIGQAPEGILEGLKRAAAWTRQERQDISKAARALNATEFSSDAVTAKFRALYRRISGARSVRTTAAEEVSS